MKKRILELFGVILVAVLAIPFAHAATGNTAADYLTSFIDALINLWNGDTNGFSRSIVNSLPLFAVFLMVFVIIWFISSETVFKGAQNPKLSIVMGIAMALIAIWTPQVFRLIMGLGNITIITIIIITFILMSVVSHKHSITQISSAQTELMKARQNEFKETHEALKLEHDLKMEEVLSKKESTEIKEATKLINSATADEEDIKNALLKSLEIMKHIVGVRDERVKANFIETLRHQLATINARMAVEKNDIDKLKSQLATLKRTMMLEETKDKFDRKKVVAKLKSDVTISPGVSDDQIVKQIESELAQLDNLAQEKIQIENEIANLENMMEQDYNGSVRAIQNSIEALATGNTTAALTDMNTAIQLVTKSEGHKITAKNLFVRVGILRREQNNLMGQMSEKVKHLEPKEPLIET